MLNYDNYDTETGKSLWIGMNGNEYISWVNSYNIFEYNPYFQTHLPTYVIKSSERISSVNDMLNALKNGEWHEVTYDKVEPS